MLRRIIQLLKTIHHFSSHYLQVTNLFTGFTHPSYADPSDRQKSGFTRFVDYLYLFFILKMLPANYHLFQFDIQKRKHFRDYLDDPVAPLLKHKLYRCLWDDRFSMLVNDKYIFHCFCRYHNIPVPELYSVLRDGICEGKAADLPTVMCRNNLDKAVLKPLSGLQGKGIHFIRRDAIDADLLSALEKGDYILQELITQHPTLDAINPHSVNTIRIITLLNRNGRAECLSAILRTSSGAHPIDNFSSGGIVIGIDMNTGQLKRRGFLKHPYGTTVASHPLTGLDFDDYQLPFWSDLQETVIKAQHVFHHLKSVGWDVAITRQGPVLIEGNIEWGTAGMQAANGGLLTKKNRELFSQYGLTF